MKIGNFKIGNSYKFDIRNVERYKNEDTDNLNKIELHYNVRKHQPIYATAKSLYRWRSVFGYHLGGILRQGVVKLADVGRPLVNTFNLTKATFTGKMHTYQRLYTSRQVCNAVKSQNKDSSTVELLKYTSFGKIPKQMHQMAASNDFSVRNVVMRKIMQQSQKKEFAEPYKQMNAVNKEFNEQLAADQSQGKRKNEKMRDIVDIKEKIRVAYSQKSDFQERLENHKERVAFKLERQKDRIVNFFKEWKVQGLPEAYNRMVERSQNDRETYERTFEFVSDNPKPKFTRGMLGEKVFERDTQFKFNIPKGFVGDDQFDNQFQLRSEEDQVNEMIERANPGNNENKKLDI